MNSWNHALSFATGEYVVVASDDDLYAPTFLAEAERLIAAHPECEVIRGRVAVINADSQITDEECRFDEYQTESQFCFYLHRYGMKCSANYMYRREAFMAKGGFVNFPLAWYTDIATPQMMASAGVLNTPSVTFYFRRSQIQLTRNHDLAVLNKKLAALLQAWQWQLAYFKTLDETPPLIAQAKHRARQHLVRTTTEHISHISLLHVKTWWRNVIKNPLLYNYEKTNIIVSSLGHLLR